jgi:hypothetical protein
MGWQARVMALRWVDTAVATIGYEFEAPTGLNAGDSLLTAR